MPYVKGTYGILIPNAPLRAAVNLILILATVTLLIVIAGLSLIVIILATAARCCGASGVCALTGEGPAATAAASATAATQGRELLP